MGGILVVVFLLGAGKSMSSQSSQVSESPAPQRLRPLGWAFFFTDTAKESCTVTYGVIHLYWITVNSYFMPLDRYNVALRHINWTIFFNHFVKSLQEDRQHCVLTLCTLWSVFFCAVESENIEGLCCLVSTAGLDGLNEYFSSATGRAGDGAITGEAILLEIWGRWAKVDPRFCPTWKYWYFKHWKTRCICQSLMLWQWH